LVILIAFFYAGFVMALRTLADDFPGLRLSCLLNLLTMSFKACCKIDGYELNVLECRFSFSQSTDACGKPVSRPKGGTIELLVESTADTNLFDWMITDTATRNGSIIFFRRDAISRLKELQFSDTYCTGYTEYFSAAGEHPMQIRLQLSARRMSLNSSVYEHFWTK